MENSLVVLGVVDTLGKDITTRFNSVAKLQSLACRSVILLALLISWICNTTLEVGHAAVRRFILGTGVGKGTMVWDDVQCSWFLLGVRKSRAKFTLRKKRATCNNPNGSKRLGVKRTANKGRQSNKKLRTGGGGAWRMFLRQKYFASGSTRNFKNNKEASREYKNLSPAEKRHLARLGRAAAFAARNNNFLPSLQ